MEDYNENLELEDKEGKKKYSAIVTSEECILLEINMKIFKEKIITKCRKSVYKMIEIIRKVIKSRERDITIYLL